MHLILLTSIIATLTQSWVVSAKPTGHLQKRASQFNANPSVPTTCDLSNAQMPAAPTPLPPPSAGLTLTHVAIGRGTQNYTCADNTANSVPVQIGANATLFNATCVAGQYPSLLSMLPGIAYNFPVPDTTPTSSVANLFESGVHYFLNKTTPFFNLNTNLHNWGTAACAKIGTSNSPNPAQDVAWLKLQAEDVTACTINEIYRLNTMGGVPPTNCLNQPALIEVQYAAEYWVWSSLPPPGY